MTGIERKEELAFAARIAQKLNGPSEAIVGYQSLLLDEVRRTGPEEALEDLEKIATAASQLSRMIQELAAGHRELEDNPEAEAKLRHDLRSPINAIIGYSEMVLEDFEDDLQGSAARDLLAILNEARRLAGQIDTAVDTVDENARHEVPETEEKLAADLERSLSSVRSDAPSLKGHILVIDDEAANREILSRYLERRGHTARAVGSAAETFQAFAEEKFDLVLLDILMPDINGIEVLIRSKSDSTLRELPVVMVSGLKETGAIARCIASGAEDYLPKPIDPVLLHARVDACLERAEWRAREKAFTEEIQYERDRADALLHAMLPAPVIHRLNNGETKIADRFANATIVFADIVGFTPLVARLDAGDLVEQLSHLFITFDDLVTQHGIEKIKTIGDAYMAASGIPAEREDHAQAAIEFARDLIRATTKTTGSKLEMKVRVGINSGPVIAGLIGRKRSIYDVWGETVNLASRMESSGMADRIQISEATKHALGGYLKTAHARQHEVKGIGKITSYFID